MDNKVKFKCPSCGNDKVESVFNGPHTCLIEEIDVDGDHEYGDYESQSCLDRWQCCVCAYPLKDDAGNIPYDDLARWCLENCPQE